ncbi:MAG TPA: hypothetical protein VKF36_15755 [Syntrophorhabdales bacterium]|nr:hypothetical protein [Syntrophorhabdales bacterium]
MDSCTARKEKTGRGMTRNRREATRGVGNLFFEMSRPVESPEMLKSWVEWFRRLHIPCAIARTEAGYTLWRKGKEVGRKRSKVPCVPMDIVCSFGFTPRELNLLKEIQQQRDDESCSHTKLHSKIERGAQAVANGGVLEYVGVRRGAGNEAI